MFRSERLIEQREKSGYSAEQLCMITKISQKKYRRYEDGELSPTCREVVRLAKALHISSDYLLGMDLPMIDELSVEDLPTDSFATRLGRLMYERDESAEEIAAVVGKAPSTVYQWRNGRVVPNSTIIISLAKHFSCTSDYLLGISVQRDVKSIS